MTRHDDTDRKALRRTLAKRAERAALAARDHDVPIIAEHDIVFPANPRFTITTNECNCNQCGGLMECFHSENTDLNGEHHRKTWRCVTCRTTMTGIYTTYEIPEWPGRSK